MADLNYLGAQDHGTAGSEFGAMDFIVRRITSRMATTSLVRVEAVRPGADLSHGFVDILPLVSQLDGANQPVPYATIQNVPYLRLQGGASAIVIDPVVGDVGLATFTAEDISTVKETKAPGPPGSRRRFSMGDALYHGGLLNGAPTQYIQFTAAGITITSADGQPVNIVALGGANITAPTTTIDGDVVITGSATIDGDMTVSGKTTTGDLTATGTVELDAATVSGNITAATVTGTMDVVGGGKSLKTHTHGGVQAGTGTSGPPS